MACQLHVLLLHDHRTNVHEKNEKKNIQPDVFALATCVDLFKVREGEGQKRLPLSAGFVPLANQSCHDNSQSLFLLQVIRHTHTLPCTVRLHLSFLLSPCPTAHHFFSPSPSPGKGISIGHLLSFLQPKEHLTQQQHSSFLLPATSNHSFYSSTRGKSSSKQLL